MKLFDLQNCVTEKWMKTMNDTIKLSPPKAHQNEDIITGSSRVPTPPLRDIVTFAEGDFLLLMIKNDTSVTFNQKKGVLGGTSV